MTAAGLPLVAVVGAGISGLAAAWHLSTSGQVRVVLLEASDRTGGALERGRVGEGGPVVDLGAESLLARRGEAIALARAVGLGGDLVVPATTRAALASRGRRYPMPRGTVMGVPGAAALHDGGLAGLLTGAELARARAEQLTSALPADGDIDVASWVGGRLGQAVVDRLVEPLLGGVHAGHARELSLRSTVPALWTTAREGTSVLEAVGGLTSVTGGSGLSSSGAGAGLGTAAGGAVFVGIRGGVARLAEATQAAAVAAGASVRTGVRARSLRRTGGRWRLVLDDVGSGGRELLDADAVVLAVPPAPAAQLLADVAPGAATELAAVATASLALVTALLPPGSLSALVGEQGPRSGLLVPPADGRLVKAMTWSSSKWAWVAAASGGVEVLRLSVGRLGEEGVLARPDADLAAAALADAGELLGTSLAPTASLVTRWPDALPQHAVGHVSRVARVRAHLAQLPGVAAAGATYDGVGVPACLASADAAAREVLADLRGPGAKMEP